MPVPVTMPQLSESMTEGTVGRWLKAPGERVAAEEPLLEILSDKVTAELPAPAGGVLRSITAEEGASLPVGTTLALIVTEDEEEPGADQTTGEAMAAVTPATSAAAPEVATPAGPAAVAPSPAGVAASELLPPAPVSPGDDMTEDDRRVYTPRVRALAAEHGLDEAELRTIQGSGLGGRLASADLLAYLARRPAGAAARPAPATLPPASPPAVAPPVATGDTLVPLTPMRRAIAAQMTRSAATTVPAWLSVEIDMGAVTAARGRQRSAFEAAEGFSLTYLPFFAAAVLAALRAFPDLNAVWEEAGPVRRPELNLGVAVALEGGLVVPVIPAADGLNVTGLARAIRERAERARAGRLAAADLEHGTFTINNTGAVGSILSQPLINVPQVAILTMEAIVRRPVVTADDAIAVRPLMNACLAYDARAVDDPIAAAFVAAVKRHLEGWRDESP